MATAISVLSATGGVEQHCTLIRDNDRFVVRDTDTGTETVMDSLDVIHHVLSPIPETGPAFIALIDHEGSTCDIGFVARRYRTRWSDSTAPDAPRPLTWDDVQDELWAALLRLSDLSEAPGTTA